MIKVKITNITNSMLTIEPFLPVLSPKQTITAEVEMITGNMLRLKHNRMILLVQLTEAETIEVTQNKTEDSPELLEGENPQDEVVEIATMSNNKSRRNKKKNRNRYNNVSESNSNNEASSDKESEVETVAEEVSSEEVTTEEITSEN